MNRLRIRLRSMILLVAGVAAILGGDRFWRRREYCLRRALIHRTSLLPWNGSHFSTPVFTAEAEERIALPIEMVQFATKMTEAIEPVGLNLSRRNTCNHGTSGLSLVLTIAKSAMDRERGNFREGLCDRRVASPELHLAKSRCVDQKHT